jgi:hypothetical protein
MPATSSRASLRPAASIHTCVFRSAAWAFGFAALVGALSAEERGAVVASLPAIIVKGKEVRDYKVVGLEPDGLRIQHGSRKDTIPFERVPRELWPAFNRDFRDVERHAARWRQIEDDTAAQWRDYIAKRAASASAPGIARLAVERVFVKPVFVYPADVRAEPGGKRDVLAAHVRWAQARYLTMLGGRDTFRVAPGGPVVFRHPQKRADFKKMPHVAWNVTKALMDADGVDRYTCPFVYLIILAGTPITIPGEGGTLNGGINTGGGIVIFTEDRLDDPTFQCGVQHELGHGFGLCHIDVCGYDMATSRSIMSYNRAYHTHGFFPSATPGVLLPEDIRVLALNRRAFPALTFEPKTDLPAGYQLSPRIAFISGADLPGLPPYAGPKDGIERP